LRDALIISPGMEKNSTLSSVCWEAIVGCGNAPVGWDHAVGDPQ